MIYNVLVDEEDNMIAFFERAKIEDNYQLCVFVDEEFGSLFIKGHEYEKFQEGDTYYFEKPIGKHTHICARRAQPEEIVMVNLTRNQNEND